MIPQLPAMLACMIAAYGAESTSESSSSSSPESRLPLQPTQQLVGATGFASFKDNLRWKIDQSVRARVDREGDISTFLFFGLDLYSVITNQNRDLVTILFQPYVHRVDNFMPTALYDREDDWELVWRFVSANFHVASDGSFNIQAGHFEVPFGLEYETDTNGTLYNYTHPQNFRMKADWGVNVNGTTDAITYNLSATRGSGNEYRSDGDPGVLAGRLGSNFDLRNRYGVSFFDGDVRTPNGIYNIQRLGLDAIWTLGAFETRAELSAGEDQEMIDVTRFIGEVNWRNGDETVFSWLQLLATDYDGPAGESDTLDARLGARYRIARDTDLSFQFDQVIDPQEEGDTRAGSLFVQLRFKF